MTRNGRPEAVLLSVDDLEGLELTLEILSDQDSVTAITEALAGPLEESVPLEQVRAELGQRSAAGG